jgi:hypothetical protein
VVRLGNFIEVGNDLFMHLIATADMRYTRPITWAGRIASATRARAAIRPAPPSMRMRATCSIPNCAWGWISGTRKT